MARDLYTNCKFFDCTNIHSKNDCYQLLQRIVSTPSNFVLIQEIYDKKRRHVGNKQISNISDVDEIFEKIYHHLPLKGDTEEWKDVENAGFSLVFQQKNNDKIYSTFVVNMFELSNYTEVEIGGSLFRKGLYDKIYFRLESYFQDLLLLSKEIYYLVSPSYGYLGETIPPFSGVVRKLIQDDVKLPVINWVNYFGPQYMEKYGEDFLLNAPGYQIEKLDDGGVFYQLSPHFLISDHNETPTEEELQSYFTQHPKIKRIKYKPLFVEEVLSKKYLENPPEKESEPNRTYIPQKIKYTSERLKNIAEDVVKTARKNLEIKLNFKPKSLEELDVAISECFDLKDPPHPTVIIDLGAYLGEVVIRNLGGKWEPAVNPWDSKIVDLPNITAIFPLNRMAKRFEYGEGSSLYPWYKSIERIVKRKQI